jgi:hypothetical protein
MFLGDFRYIHAMSPIACEWRRCLQSWESQVIPSSYSHEHETRTETLPPYQTKNRARSSGPGDDQQILVKSGYSSEHRILSYLYRRLTGNA